MWSVSLKMHHLPVIVGIWFISTFIIVYLLAVSSEHVYPFFPYVSDTVVYPPESCIFGQLMYMGCVIFALSMYIRYLQIKMYIDLGYIHFPKRRNNISIASGLISLITMCITWTIPEIDSIVIHLLGAGTTIALLIFYFSLQTIISYETIQLKEKLPHHGITKRLFYFRLFLLCSIIILFWTTGIFGILSYREFTGSSIIWWTPKDGGFQLRLVSTFSEWLIFICMCVYWATVTDGLKQIEFKEVLIKLKETKEFNGDLANNNGNALKLD